MGWFLHWVGRAGIALFEQLPLPWIARLGRALGGVAYAVDRRHRRVAIENLTACFGDTLTPQAIAGLAHENYRRIGEAFACGVRTTGMSAAAIREVVELSDPEGAFVADPGRPGENRVLALGHFGNFEVFASFGTYVQGFEMVTTYRPLRPPALDRFHAALRRRSGCAFYDRVTQGRELRSALSRGGVLLGLLSDQHAGDHGAWLPFLGRECSCSTAPALYALRYEARLFPGICYRTGLGRWRVEMDPEIPVRVKGRRRGVLEITADINRVFESAVRRDPANWFWVHRRWKPRPPSPARGVESLPDTDAAGPT